MRSMRTRLAASGAVFLLALIPAAAMAAEEVGEGITGIDWRLTALIVDGTMSPVPEGVIPTLRLEEGQASGSTGCNTFSGEYALEGNALTFEALRSTLRLCEDPLGAVEGPYMEALPLVAAWSLTEDGTLQLIGAEGTTLLEFAAGTSDPGTGVEGVTWILSRQAVDRALSELPADILVSMRLEGGAAGGTGGCNSWFADYALEGDRLSFSDIGSTLIACEEPANTVERTFFANLAAVASYTASESALSLADAEGTTILEFEADDPGSVVGSWVATGINVAGGVVSSATTSQVTAEFTEDGRLSGNDGCNQYDATYEVDGPRIAIGPLASTKMACADDDLNTQAAAYAEALASAAVWSVDADGTLQLRDADGALLVSYSPAAG